jgi:YbbR domain-containing protein
MRIKNGFSYVLKKSSRAFIISFLVSLFIWVLINLSKTQEKSIRIKLLYENAKQGTVVKAQDSILKVKVQGSGFSLLSNKLANLEYSIDTQNQNKQWNWNINDHQFKSLFPKNIKVLSVSPQQLNFKIITLFKKKVPVNSFIQVDTKLGYDIVSSSFSKDSILIFGESSILDNIHAINTDSLTIEDVFENIKGEVSLIKENTDLNLETKSIAYSYDIERFTEGGFLLDLRVKNIPKDKKISIFPKQVKLRFQAPLSIFSKVKEEDFGVYVDYNDINNSNLLPIYIEYFPEGVKNVKVLKKTVTYLLIEL